MSNRGLLNLPEEFEDILTAQVLPGQGRPIDWPPHLAKHEFLEFLVRRNYCLHGSTHKSLTILEPRTASSPVAGQAETAVYVTTDTLMALFFAILDRSKISFFATRSDPSFFFLSPGALHLKPWTDGMVYIFKRDDFEFAGGHHVSYQPVSPDAKLQLSPCDFPLFNRIYEIESLEETDEKFEKLKTEFYSR